MSASSPSSPTSPSSPLATASSLSSSSASSSSSSSFPPACESLEEEVLRLRKENKGLRDEVKGLCDENEQLRAAQAESLQRLVSRETWPDIKEPVNRGYEPIEIICALKREFRVPYTDDEAKALLCKAGFNPDDVREVAEPSSGGFPLEWFSKKGDLMMCHWLYSNGAAEDISRANNYGSTPMLRACRGGHLSVCKWLLEVGADGDISRANEDGYTPMLWACINGHLSVCKWLFEVGADGDISRADNNGRTPMHEACSNGHLSVCKWLFEVGADRDISRENNGFTPMRLACMFGQLSVCEWLVLKGALNDPESAGQHISQAIVKRNVVATHAVLGLGQIRPRLLAWAQGVVAASDSFRSTVLMGTFPFPSSAADATALLRRAIMLAGTAAEQADMIVAALNEDQRNPLLQQLRPVPAISKLSGHAGVLELVADFLGGVRRGRELRNARELAECLVAIGVVITEESE